MAVTYTHLTNDIHIATITVASDDCGDASATVSGVKGQIIKCRTTPGACPAPDDNWDVVLTDSASIDILQGYGANHDNMVSEDFVPYIKETVTIEDACCAIVGGNTQFSPVYHDGSDLTATFSNLDCCAAAEVTLEVWYRP